MAKAGKRVVLVDVRTADEQQVSMIPGAMTQQQFEAQLGDLRRHIDSGTVVVAPYCTGASGASSPWAPCWAHRPTDRPIQP